MFTITASAPVANPTVVNYHMIGNAVQDVNYSLSGLPGQATIAAGTTSTTVTLTVLTAPKRTKTATMVLDQGIGYQVGQFVSAQVSIRR